MKTNLQDSSNRTGGILVLVMVVLVTFGLVVAALLQLGLYSTQEAEYQFNKAQAFWLAEAGLEQFKSIADTNRFPISYAPTARYWSNNIPNAGSYSVTVTDETNNWNNTLLATKKYIITSVGWARNGAVQTNQLKATIPTFGYYLWATHDENGVWFTTGDRIYGKAYTDSQLHINGTPVFYDTVQSASNSVIYQNGGSLAAFKGGLQLSVPQLDWVSVQAQVAALISDPAAVKLSGDYEVTFADTKVKLQKVTVDKKGVRTPNGSAITNALSPGEILYVTGNAYVTGIVGTRVSVATTAQIHITDDVVYKSASNPDPSTWSPGWEPASTEALGLYSQTGVVIDSIGSNVGTVNIHAAILAPNGSFTAEDYQKSHSGNSYINFYGSIGQYTRGAVGLTSGPGYLKNYHYDTRFGELPPPGIPYSVFYFSDWTQL